VPQAPIDREEEYIDEDKYTTVTVEAVNVDRDGLHKPVLEKPEDEGSGQEDGAEKEQEADESSKRKWDPKKKKKKFRYENKFERTVEARKQRAKRRKPKE
jgi:ribosomal RNA-processing protein 17